MVGDWLIIVAAETSALTIIGVPALAYGGDISLIQIIIGYVIARIIIAIIMVPQLFQGRDLFAIPTFCKFIRFGCPSNSWWIFSHKRDTRGWCSCLCGKHTYPINARYQYF
jgi:hypothetical protein